jgi:dolichol kinase
LADGPSEGLHELAGRTRGLQPVRRAAHVLAGSAAAWTVYALSPGSSTARWLFGSVLAATFVADSIRLRSDALNRLFFRAFRHLACPREVDGLSLTWFLLGIFLVLWIPGETTVLASILVLTFSDPAASVVGRTWGTRPLGSGTVEGTAAFFLTALGVLTPFVGMWAAIPVAAASATAEAVSTRIDDNTTVPVTTAVCLWAIAASGG